MKIKHVLLAISLAMMFLPLLAQDAGLTLPPNYKRIAKEVRKADGPFFYDSLQARFDRCDTSLTVDDLRCLYFGNGDASLCESHRRYWLLYSRFGRHGGAVNDAWTRYQMLVSAVWSTGDGSRRRPLHVNSLDDASFLMASDTEGYYVLRTYIKRKYVLLRYIAKDGQPSGDVWFYIRK
ncbi:MAG: hypothetical protein IKR33_04835 [Bacteroidales bacterium]|nr:hypothetical protein [Bacteroidales bacterium]